MPGKNKRLLRYLESRLLKTTRGRISSLILGPRQVGKTTLVKKILQKFNHNLTYLLQNPSVRLELESNPSKIIGEIRAYGKKPLVFIDEAQKAPELFDAVQLLIDAKESSFILTGSSARKLRRSGANLLPGRIKRMHLTPFLWGEMGWIKENTIKPLTLKNINTTQEFSFNDSLIYGSLPGIVQHFKKNREDMLRSYTEIYLEEEIRAEALTRKMGAFSRFLELAAIESGTNPNMTNLSNESGVSQPAIKEFYQLLEDTLVIERVDPYLKNARKRILRSSKYYFFDLGVRNALARLPFDIKTINAQKGILFEHAVMLEIIRRIKVLNKPYKVCFWRTAGGAEVDCVIDLGNSVIPIEIKSSKRVTASELKGLKSFLEEYKKEAKQGYVITLGERKEKLTKNITALPWFYL